MRRKCTAQAGKALLIIHGLLLASCEPKSGPQTDSQTNWLRACEGDAECDGLECVCGVCTRSCDDAGTCENLQRADCVLADEAGSVAACSGNTPTQPGLCLPRCDSQACDDGEMCVAGACTPLPTAAIGVTLDATDKQEVLTGFGATLAYIENQLVRHPIKDEVYQAMFAGLGLDILRLQNRYAFDDDNLESTGELVSAAAESLGRTPTVILSSWSPPPSLKASGSTMCQGDAETCTLALNAEGEFDYAGFATNWRDALQAYAEAGVVPDYVGIQNNPDFVPSAASPGEACKFAPTEGLSTTYVDGTQVEATYPGYAQAFEAVVDALGGMPSPPMLIAPESSSVQWVAEYARHLNLENVVALAHNFYGIDPNAVDTSALRAAAEFGRTHDRPLFQTEMASDGYGTAILIHDAMVVEGASAYLQSVLVKPESALDTDMETLIALSATDFTLKDPYHALRHYARFTDPGWTRVGTTSEAETVLTSAWLSPDGGALTAVLVNADERDAEVALAIEGFDVESASELESRVIRTAFGGVERSAELGPLSAEGDLRIPGRSIVTVILKL